MVKEIEIDMDPGGPVAQASSTVQWVQEGGEGELITGHIAGHPITAIRVGHNPVEYELHYLGLVGRGFDSQAFALASAPAFAEQVLRYLAEMAAQTEAMPKEAEQ